MYTCIAPSLGMGGYMAIEFPPKTSVFSYLFTGKQGYIRSIITKE